MFSSFRDGREDLFLLSPDSGEIIKMGLEAFYPQRPAWSPDWQKIAFERGANVPERDDILVVDAGCVDASQGCLPYVRNLTADDPGLFGEPAWSPDGTRIAYTYRVTTDPTLPFQIWVMNSDGSNRTRLTDIYGSDPAWSPDGHSIAFESDVVGKEWGVLPGQSCAGGNVFIMNSDGSQPRRLTDKLPDSFGARWSPDGKRLAFSSLEGECGEDLEAHFHLYILDLSSEAITRISSGEVHGTAPGWSPDGSRLVFLYDGPGRGISLVNIDGSGWIRLTVNEGTDPAWQP